MYPEKRPSLPNTVNYIFTRMVNNAEKFCLILVSHFFKKLLTIYSNFRLSLSLKNEISSEKIVTKKKIFEKKCQKKRDISLQKLQITLFYSS